MKTALANEQTLHLLLRVPLVTRVAGDAINTVDAHNEVIRRLGQAWIAKFGTPGTEERANTLKFQIEQGRKTFLVLVAKRGMRFLAHEAPLVSIHYGRADSQILKLAPEYYSRLDQSAALWLAVRRLLQLSDLARFRLASNQRPIVEVLSECRTASMLVERRHIPAIDQPLSSA